MRGIGDPVQFRKHRALGAERYNQSGFTYVMVLFALALFGVTLASTGTLWSEVVRRDKENDLIRIGEIYVQAIESYYQAAPGSYKSFPKRLDDLLVDQRYLGIRRHLRRLYPDPVTGSLDWGLVPSSDGGIAGVYSRSTLTPLRKTGIEPDTVMIDPAARYADWRFVYRPR